MASLANQTISSTYDGLIKTSTDQPVPISGVQLLEDGVGNSLALSVGRANQGVTVTGTLTATSITGVLADGVTATTQTLGDNSTKVATTAYVDAQVTASDLDFAGDSGTGAVDLDSQTFTIAGTANEIETVASGQTITIGLPNNVNVAGNLTVDTNTLYVDATNNRVGVGTPSPLAKLHIASTNAAITDPLAVGNALRFTDNDSTQNNGQITGTIEWETKDADNAGIQAYITSVSTNTGLGNLAFATGAGGSATERMRITSAGNVGIGTSSPARPLDVIGSVGSAVATFATAVSGSTNKGIRIVPQTYGASIETVGLSTELAFNTSDASSSSERMRITSAGNVGIGTSSPAQKLTIDSGYVLIKDNAYDTYFLSKTRSDGSQLVGFQSHSLGALSIHANSSERMRIDSSGNVGIGATNPSDKLVVIGDVASTGSLKITGNSSTPSAGAFVHRPASNTLALGTASTERMRIDSIGRISVGFSSWSSFGVVNLGVGQEDEGRVTIARGSNGQVARFYNSTGFAGDITLTGASTAYNTSSDYRLKENVVEMTGALDRVDALKPSRFNFIADPETTVDGFLAHEVAEVVPEAISGEKDAVDEEGNPVYQGIDQSKLVPLLVGAIKELRAEIETLKSQIIA